MPDQVLTDDEVLATGMAALRQALAPDDRDRFLRLCQFGTGDYTAERHVMLAHWSMDEFLELCRNAAGTADQMGSTADPTSSETDE